MFNLESSIANWRRLLLAAGFKTSAALDELELHLREEIEQHMASGLSAPAAFEIAIRKIGGPRSLRREFIKNETFPSSPRAKIGVGIGSLILGAALMIPGSLQLRDDLIIHNGNLGLWLLGWLALTVSMRQVQMLIPHRQPGSDLVAVELPRVLTTLKIGTGLIVMLTGLALMFPAGVQAWSAGLVKFAQLGWFVFGFALALVGTVTAFHPYKKRLA